MELMLATLRAGLARLRYVRATLWLLPLEAFIVSVLAGMPSHPGKGDAALDADVSFGMFVAFIIYLLAITAGRFAIAAWEATRASYSVLRALGLLAWLVTLVVTLMMPVNLLFVSRSAMGYDHCFAFKCYAVLPFVLPIISGGLVLMLLAPTSLLWFRLAKPRPPVPPRPPSRPAPDY